METQFYYGYKYLKILGCEDIRVILFFKNKNCGEGNGNIEQTAYLM